MLARLFAHFLSTVEVQLHLLPSAGTPEQSQSKSADSQVAKLAGTLQHYRDWAGQIQARYQLFNPDAARPARRIYVGGLNQDTTDVSLTQLQPYLPLSISNHAGVYIIVIGIHWALIWHMSSSITADQKGSRHELASDLEVSKAQRTSRQRTIADVESMQ